MLLVSHDFLANPIFVPYVDADWMHRWQLQYPAGIMRWMLRSVGGSASVWCFALRLLQSVRNRYSTSNHRPVRPCRRFALSIYLFSRMHDQLGQHLPMRFGTIRSRRHIDCLFSILSRECTQILVDTVQVLCAHSTARLSDGYDGANDIRLSHRRCRLRLLHDGGARVNSMVPSARCTSRYICHLHHCIALQYYALFWNLSNRMLFEGIQCAISWRVSDGYSIEWNLR